MTGNNRAMITGVTGFAGKWLSEYLLANGQEVYGIDIGQTCPFPHISYHQADILNTDSLAGFFFEVNPGYVYHLAAISFPPEADVSPGRSLEVNIMGTISVFDAVRKSCPDSIVLSIGSSKEYSRKYSGERIPESSYPEPVDFYGVSKYSAELTGLQYVNQFGTDIRFTRSFNHTGPGQSPLFVCSDWAKQVAEISLGISEPVIRVGNLQSVIDFSDVRDVVKAYYHILTRGKKGEIYNVCSGKGYTLGWILEYLTGKCPREIKILTEPRKLQMHKTHGRMVGDNTRLIEQTGWKSTYSMEKTLDDLYDYWSEELKKS